MATGISMETELGDHPGKGGGGEEGGAAVRLRSPVLAEASNMSTGDLGSNLSSFLDISIPEPAAGVCVWWGGDFRIHCNIYAYLI